MADLILLTVGNNDPMRFATVLDAEKFAKTASGEPIILTVTPRGGGPMTTLRFDKSENDWFPAE